MVVAPSTKYGFFGGITETMKEIVGRGPGL